MISMNRFQQIREGLNQGETISALAKRLKLNRKTIRRYKNSNAPPRYKKRTQSTKEDPFSSFEAEVLSKLKSVPDLTGSEIFELISDDGYSGSERTIQRRLKKLKESKPKERFFEQEYTPGEQAQFDFKEKILVPFVSGEKTIHLHFGTLPYSNTCLVKAYPFKNYECFIDGIHSFFSKLGGRTKNIRIDNLSPCVKRVLEGSRREYTDSFNKAIEYYGFGVLPCAPGKGSDKGDVERDIRSHANRFLRYVKLNKLVFRDFNHLNDVLESYIERREKASVKELKVEEKKFLEKLQDEKQDITCKIESMKAGQFGTVRIGKATYSVPDEAIGLECRVVAGAYSVDVYRGPTLVATHPRQPEEGNGILLGHVLRSILRKPQAMVRWRHKEILFPNPIFNKYYARLTKITDFPGQAETQYLKSINLIQHTTLAEIACAMELVLERDSMNLYEELRDLLLLERRPNNIFAFVDSEGFKQKPIEPDLEKYNQFIPNKGAI